MATTVNAPPTPVQHEHPASAPDPPADSEGGQAPLEPLQKPVQKPMPRRPPLYQIYALPVPIRTFPLPSLYPNNPLSWLHFLYSWATQVLSPPPPEPSAVHQGFWSKETRSVHVRDPASIRALWEQGFFGKGNYSRSEPNWLRREQGRKGRLDGHVAEEATNQRREERKLMKWERARKEQEAILKTRLLEAWVAPVGPRELLALPNSHAELPMRILSDGNGAAVERLPSGMANGILADGAGPEDRPNGISSPLTAESDLSDRLMTASENALLSALPVNGIHDSTSGPKKSFSEPTRENGATAASKRRKSVRFSPKVESTTYQLTDPPSPGHGHGHSHGQLANGKVLDDPPVNGDMPLPRANGTASAEPREDVVLQQSAPPVGEIVDREHLQLTTEEAFYLAFGLGALTITDPASGSALTNQDLFTLFRQNSYYPVRMSGLEPDDPFLLQYAVYHHFRSLGWVVRPGVKFGIDWLLYNRGPAFSHAEFAVLVLPAYTADEWKAQGRQAPPKSWHWLHSLNRIQATVLKTLVLVYVDVPPPSREELDPAATLARYRVREFVVKRWVSNRNRESVL
ncbi:putative tRNA-splicing endonuclease subunit Sen2 [Xylariaceae sp. FL0804]|nr:putative tRNA-splicing endonuclease subunit Sen2 [Xylariaceae sp. FL0804]